MLILGRAYVFVHFGATTLCMPGIAGAQEGKRMTDPASITVTSSARWCVSPAHSPITVTAFRQAYDWLLAHDSAHASRR